MVTFEIHNADCVEYMSLFMGDNSVDAIVTDPPYGLGFMGKKWDVGVPAVEVFEQCLRVLKPGGHLLAFGGSRTYHRLAVAVEDAGFEIRDQIMWVYGSGFPKSQNVSKAIDKAAGAEREVVGFNESAYRPNRKNRGLVNASGGSGFHPDNGATITAPATDAAKQWDGWGTALKPAHEPIVMARKPLTGTVAQNVLEYGTGAINVDGCRVPTDGKETLSGGHCTSGQQMTGGWERPWMKDPDAVAANAERSRQSVAKSEELGRYPANLIHDGSDEVTSLFPESNGSGPARFFYCAKANKKDRTEGGEVENKHPTVKPTDLMRYLVRMVTPPGGTVFDPFTGSGSTGKAAMMEGFDFIGTEAETEYAELAEKRLAALANTTNG